MNTTKIPWVKNIDGTQGYTLNPLTGCLNGCPYCYARKLAEGRLKSRYLGVGSIVCPRDEDDIRVLLNPFYPRFWPDKLKEVKSLKPRSGVFVCSMSDLFGIGVPEEWTNQVLDAIKSRPDCRFYLLTKQPQNMVKYSPFPDNCWVGVSTDGTAQAPVHRALYPSFEKIQAPVKFVSFEPLLGRTYIDPKDFQWTGTAWVMIGAQTKPTKLPDLSWVGEIVEAADQAGVKVFLKDSLHEFLYSSAWDNDMFWARKAKMRQEIP